MSNHLARLIQRRADPSGALQPRLPSRFEQAPSAPDTEADLSTESVELPAARTPTMAPAPLTPQPPQRPEHLQTKPDASAAVPPPAPRAEPVSATTDRQRPRSVTESRTGPDALRAAPEPPRPGPPPSPGFGVDAPPATPGAATMPPPPGRSASSRPIAPHRPAVGTAKRIDDRAPEPMLPIAAPASPPIAAPADRLEERPQEPPPLDVEPLFPPEPVSADLPDRIDPPRRTPEPPDVHVHIGSVVVQAAVPEPPSSPRRKRPGAPALSLEDYLASRSGGRP
jgi:hypothetical protein